MLTDRWTELITLPLVHVRGVIIAFSETVFHGS